MKITYLGTAAAEGFPAVFCNCKYCNEARMLGGKNIRSRSQTLINEDLLIDFPADTYSHISLNGIEGDKIEYLLITHPHSDHFYLEDFYLRCGAYAHNPTVPVLKVLCPAAVRDLFPKIPPNVEVSIPEPYQPINLGPYTVTALPARHLPNLESFIYIIQGGKTLLYAHDTGYFYDEVFSYIERNKIVFDMVSMDCTNVDLPISDEGRHMGLPNIQRALDRLYSMGAVTDATVKYINHFSHNGNPIHHILEEKAQKLGYLVAYDGCQVII